jgi:hypothetical protein
MSGKPHTNQVFLLIFLLIFFLGGCRNVPATSPTLSSQPAWTVNLSPSLSWLAPHFNFCALQQTGIGIVLDNASNNPDIQFTWGISSSLKDKFPYTLGWDEIAVVENQKNPLKSIDLSRLRSIYMGQTRTWKSVSKDLQDLGNIQVVTYPSSLDVEQLFDQAVLGGTFRDPFAALVSEPQEVRTEILGNPSAIGILPAHWVVPGLNVLEINSNNSLILRYPILAITRQKPDAPLQNWLLCLQNAIKLESNQK